MDCNSTRIPYRQTNTFSRTVLDYLDQSPSLKSFFAHPVSLKGILSSIDSRKKVNTDRRLLVDVLNDQYKGSTQVSGKSAEAVNSNIQSLLSEDTFTVTTAHQNNLFTGPLYFIYKIVHVIRLADHLNEVLPEYHFVPVFYMGSEDADFEELNHIYLSGEKLEWKTPSQNIAVGRMKIDKNLISLIDRMEGQLSVFPNGRSITEKLRQYYKEGVTVAEATFGFVNDLFGEYGLVILQPDNSKLKKQMNAVFSEDLFHQKASAILEESTSKLEKAGYKVQANPREINLFYLTNKLRERIERVNGSWKVLNSNISFDEKELLKELENHPERFSPNVILRGLYQEKILPNIAFIGGGGELAYWLQLKSLFEHYHVPFPLLVLRNSFLLVEPKWKEPIVQLGFYPEDFFQSENELINKWVTRESAVVTKLNGSLEEIEKLYESFKKQAATIDASLEKHVDALKQKTVYRLQELEKKMLRAEKRKYTDQQRKIRKIKYRLFPNNGLQERHENLCYYYALMGKSFIDLIYEHSLALEQEFTIITC